MKIFEVIPTLTIGGAERFVVNFSNELAARGHDVTIITINDVNKYGDLRKFINHKISVISLDKPLGADFKAFFRLTRLIKRLKPDVVHTHLAGIFYNFFSPYFYPKAKYVHTIHNDASKEATSGVCAWARKWLITRGKTIAVSISEESLQSFYKYYGRHTHSEMIYNGVPTIDINPDIVSEFKKDTINLVNVARIMPQKNQLALIQAVENLNALNLKVELYIIGCDDTPDSDRIKKMGFKHTTFLGPKDNPRDYIAAADAFVLSSIYEGMPLTLIECFSAGAIPICTPVGGIVNMINDGENGILATSTDTKALEGAIIRFINLDCTQKRKMREASLESFSKYTLKECVDNYLRLFENQ